MSPDAELLVIFGVLHLVALVLGGALFLMFLRSDGASTWTPDDEDDSGGGGNDRLGDKPKTSPSGGIPLPYSVQSDTRLRGGHDRLADPGRPRVRTRTRPRLARGHQRRRLRVPALHLGERRLAHAVVADEALLEHRRLWPGVAPV